MRLRFCFLALLTVGLLTTLFAQATSEEIVDPDGKFSLLIPASVRPADGWHAVESQDGLGRKQLEIVYKVREEGLLRIRRADIDKGAKLVDSLKKDETQTLTFLPGYTKGAVEEFSVAGGKIPAMVATYDFTQGGRPKMGRNYYLQVNDTTVYVLRFTGNRGTMGALRSQTDLIARSFKAN